MPFVITWPPTGQSPLGSGNRFTVVFQPVTASATRIPSASDSHRRVEPSTSVNKNVTTPEGAAAAAADTPAECHNRRAPTSHIGRIRAQTRHAPR